MDQPSKVANPARGQLNGKTRFAPENLVSRKGAFTAESSPRRASSTHLGRHVSSGEFFVTRDRPKVAM